MRGVGRRLTRRTMLHPFKRCTCRIRHRPFTFQPQGPDEIGTRVGRLSPQKPGGAPLEHRFSVFGRLGKRSFGIRKR